MGKNRNTRFVHFKFADIGWRPYVQWRRRRTEFVLTNEHRSEEIDNETQYFCHWILRERDPDIGMFNKYVTQNSEFIYEHNKLRLTYLSWDRYIFIEK
jgi:hypothetical protein